VAAFASIAQTPTTSWFRTLDTPGDAHATRSARCFSAHERTMPRSVTVLSVISAAMRSASIPALR
jgi:hypothetical protein